MAPPSHLLEVGQHGVAVLGQDGLGVELHAFQGREVRIGQRALVAHTHDLAVFGLGRDVQALGQGGALDGQRVVADHGELPGQAGEDALFVGGDDAGLAVHLLAGTDHLAAQGGTDALVAQAHAQDGQLAGKTLQRGHADTGFGGRAGTGREHQAVGLHGGDLVEGDLVVAHHLDLFAQFAEVLHQVEGEAVVVVDHQQHERIPQSGFGGGVAPRRDFMGWLCTRPLAGPRVGWTLGQVAAPAGRRRAGSVDRGWRHRHQRRAPLAEGDRDLGLLHDPHSMSAPTPPVTRPAAPAATLLGLELMRFVCALSVLLWHYQHFYVVGPVTADLVHDHAVQPLAAWLAPFYGHGWLGVQAFWALSGFIFFWKYGQAVADGKVAAGRFAWLRFSRLYPLHLVTLLAMLPLIAWYRAQTGQDYVYTHNDAEHFVLQLFLAI